MPGKALRLIWRQLDRYYDTQVETAAERIKPILAKGKLDKDDVDGLIDLQSDLLAIHTQTRNAGMEKELDRQDIIRDIVNKRLPFMSDEFYRTETKRQKKDPKFRMGYDELLESIQDKARTLKARGISSKRDATDTAKVAATSGQTTEKWSSKVASPPKEQPEAKSCFNCSSVRHGADKCNSLRMMGMEKMVEKLKKDGRCFSCLEKTSHVAKFCTEKKKHKCELCGGSHPTILCGLPKFLSLQREKANEKKKEEAQTSKKTTEGEATAERRNLNDA